MDYYLLDTHTFIWFMNGDENLSVKVKKIITDKNNDCLLSIASIWEIAIKIQIGKLELKNPFNHIVLLLSTYNIEILPVNFEHLQALLQLDMVHRDPFDRVIIAQGIFQKLTILTIDKNFRHYPVKCIW